MSVPMSPWTFTKLLGEELIELTVGFGAEQKAFSIHKKLLLSSVPFFYSVVPNVRRLRRITLNTKSIDHVYPHEIALFVSWLYSIDRSRHLKGRPLADIIQVHIFASIWKCGELMFDSLIALASCGAVALGEVFHNLNEKWESPSHNRVRVKTLMHLLSLCYTSVVGLDLDTLLDIYLLGIKFSSERFSDLAMEAIKRHVGDTSAFLSFDQIQRIFTSTKDSVQAPLRMFCVSILDDARADVVHLRRLFEEIPDFAAECYDCRYFYNHTVTSEDGGYFPQLGTRPQGECFYHCHAVGEDCGLMVDDSADWYVEEDAEDQDPLWGTWQIFYKDIIFHHVS